MKTKRIVLPIAFASIFVLMDSGIRIAGGAEAVKTSTTESYEVMIINKASIDFESIQLCIENGSCYSGRLNKSRSIWLTKGVSSRKSDIKVVGSSSAPDLSSMSCVIPAPVAKCAYEISLSDKGLYCPKQNNDCIRF